MPALQLAPALLLAATDFYALRRDLLASIWEDGILPSRHAPLSIEPTNTSGVTKLKWNVSHEFFELESTVYHSLRKADVAPSTKKRASDTFVIHHHGHARACDHTLPESRCDGPLSFFDYYNISQWVHDDLGADIFFHYMPLFPPNTQPAGYPSSVQLHHQWFEQWQLKGDSTIRYFLEPVILSINYALSLGYKHVLMMGKSGGGWTTTLAAAIDPRISISFPIAGSIPLSFPHKSWDFEQKPRAANESWYMNACNYTCLYALAALPAAAGEPPRHSLQVLHENDPCCYYGKGRHESILSYDAAVTNWLGPAAAGGTFSTAITDWNQHAVCLRDRVVIGSALSQIAKLGRWSTLPCDILRSESVRCPEPGPPPSSSSPLISSELVR